MEEKKKRWRPSLAQYRELEKKLESQIDGTSKLVADCDGWREKYRNLLDDISKGNVDVVLKDHIDSLRCENNALERSNEFMSREIGNLRDTNKAVIQENKDLRDELFRLKSRGFFARVFNK